MSFKLRAIQPKEFVGDEALTIATADGRYVKQTDLPTNSVTTDTVQDINANKTFKKDLIIDTASVNDRRIKFNVGSKKGFDIRGGGGRVSFDVFDSNGESEEQYAIRFGGPEQDYDLVTKKYLYASLPDLTNYANTTQPNTFSGTQTFNSGINVNNFTVNMNAGGTVPMSKITGSTSVTNKQYVDNQTKPTEWVLRSVFNSYNHWTPDGYSKAKVLQIRTTITVSGALKPLTVVLTGSLGANDLSENTKWYSLVDVVPYYIPIGEKHWRVCVRILKQYDNNNDIEYYKDNVYIQVYGY